MLHFCGDLVAFIPVSIIRPDDIYSMKRNSSSKAGVFNIFSGQGPLR